MQSTPTIGDLIFFREIIVVDSPSLLWIMDYFKSGFQVKFGGRCPFLDRRKIPMQILHGAYNCRSSGKDHIETRKAPPYGDTMRRHLAIILAAILIASPASAEDHGAHDVSGAPEIAVGHDAHAKQDSSVSVASGSPNLAALKGNEASSEAVRDTAYRILLDSSADPKLRIFAASFYVASNLIGLILE
jgi:hypothetical protein